MFCIDCKYPLVHVHSRRCPECGRAFDPDNRSSYLSETNGLTIKTMQAIERTRTQFATALGLAVIGLLGLVLLSTVVSLMLRAL